MVFQPNAKFLSFLNGSAAAVFALPLLVFAFARLTHQSQDEQQQQQQQQNENNQYNNNQYDYNNQQRCRWWQWGCSDNYQYQQDGSRDERDNELPVSRPTFVCCSDAPPLYPAPPRRDNCTSSSTFCLSFPAYLPVVTTMMIMGCKL